MPVFLFVWLGVRRSRGSLDGADTVQVGADAWITTHAADHDEGDEVASLPFGVLSTYESLEARTYA